MNPKFLCVHSCSALVPILSQINPVPIVLRTSGSGHFLSGVPTNGHWTLLISPACHVSGQSQAPSFNPTSNILPSLQIMQASDLAPTSKPPPRHSVSLYLAAPSSTQVKLYCKLLLLFAPHLPSHQFSLSVTSCAQRRGQLKGFSAVQRKWDPAPKLKLLLQINTPAVAFQVTTFTTTLQLSLFWVKLNSSTLSNPISLTFMLTVSSHLPYDFQAHSSLPDSAQEHSKPSAVPCF